MPQVVTCPHCKGQCAVEEAHLGKSLKCPRCSGQFRPGGAAPEAEAPEAPASKRRPLPTFERERATTRAAERAKSSGYEKWILAGIVGAIVLTLLAVILGRPTATKTRVTSGPTMEELDNSPAAIEKRKFEEERKRFFEQQEQTPGAKRIMEREQGKGK